MKMEMFCPKCKQNVKSHKSWKMNSKLASLRTFLFRCWNCGHEWRIIRRVREVRQKQEVWK